jgi:hypothetical protein
MTNEAIGILSRIDTLAEICAFGSEHEWNDFGIFKFSIIWKTPIL